MTQIITSDNVFVSDTGITTKARNEMNTEIIRNRKSVRTYKEQAIPEKTLNQVRDYLEKGIQTPEDTEYIATYTVEV